MQYQMGYALASFLFLCVVALRFFSLRRFPHRLNRFFGVLLCVALVDLTLDIAGSYTIDHAADFAPWVNYVINTLFYSVQVVFPALLMLYIMILGGRRLRETPCTVVLLMPAVFFLGMMAANFFTKSVFYVKNIDGVNVYCRGEGFKLLYVGSVFYFAACLAWLFALRRQIKRTQREIMLLFIILNVATMIGQYYYPHILLTGLGISLAVLMMFLTMENPEATTDAATGVFTYAALLSYLQTLLQEKRSLFLVAVDVSGLRRVNKTYGMQVGDEALHQMGTYLSLLQSHHSWVFRMPSTRFLLVFRHKEDYRAAIGKIEERFSRPWASACGPLKFTAKIRFFDGKTTFTSPEEIVSMVDYAYREEEWADALSCRMDTSLLDKNNRNGLVEEAIRTALETGEGFYLNYQPLYCAATGYYSSIEVLLRLYSKKLGPIAPGEFIVIAEQKGLIQQIDLWVVRNVCEFIRRTSQLCRAGVTCVEINLSAANFNSNIDDALHKIVTDAGVDPALLCFEVTETAAVRHQLVLAQFMHSMQTRGYRFALDDFGTGYANLAQVVSLPFNIVKLDRTLLVAKSRKEQMMFGSLLRLFDQMELSTVTEGVENQSQAQNVIALGCDFLQGYYYAYPMHETDLLAFLQRENTAPQVLARKQRAR